MPHPNNMRVLWKLGPLSFKFHHIMIGPMYAITSLWWKILKRRKVKKQKCNTWSIKFWLDFLCFKQYPNVVHKISIVNDKKKMVIVLNFIIIKRKKRN
jgi:hypothetical protein